MACSSKLKKRALNAATKEKNLQDACQALRNGEYKKISEASRALNVSYDTLRRRMRGETMARQQAHVKQQLLNDTQETVLCQWMAYLGATGHPVHKKTLIPKVEALCGKRPGRNWVQGFLARHPDILFCRPSKLDPKRARAFNFTTADHHFKLLKAFLEEKDIPWENVYNMDEKGIQLGGGRKGTQQKCFFSREDRVQYRISSDDLKLVTIIEAVCADGTFTVPPGFVFSSVTMHTEWFCEDGAMISTSENGWTNDFLCTQWFEKIFIPAVLARNVSGKPILLIYDGHGSHVQLRMIELALQHNIHLYCLPPHTTHYLQPLDVGVFGPLQKAWAYRCDAVLDETGQPMKTQDVVREYMAARQASFKPETVLNAWRRSGIRPLNPNVFSEGDFTPSHSTSTIAHFPESFLTRLPPAPDASSDDLYDPNAIDDEEVGEGDGEEMDDESGSSDCGSLPATPTPTMRHQRTRSSSSFMSHPQTPEPGSIPNLQQALEQINHLKGHVEELTIQRDAAKTHAILVQRQNSVLHHQLHAKTASKEKSSRRIYTKSRVVTSEEGRAEAAAQHAEQLAKEKEAEDKRTQKAAAEAESQARRAAQGDNVEFKGSLLSRNKDALKDIAHALNVSLEGTKNELNDRISEHLAAHPELKADKRFTGLYTSRSRGQKRPLEESQENTPTDAAPPASQRPCLSDISNGPSSHV